MKFFYGWLTEGIGCFTQKSQKTQKGDWVFHTEITENTEGGNLNFLCFL